MKVDHRSRRGALAVAGGAAVARWLLSALGATWRVEVVEGGEHLEALAGGRGPVVLSFWHNRIVMASPVLKRRLLRHGFRITLLASLSRDGELVSAIGRRWGLDIVRGSSSRGGRQAIRAIFRNLTRHDSSPLMIPDGPRGPLYEHKVSSLVVSQLSGRPILQLGFAAARAWRLRSWDRLIVPRPFARVAVVVGAPLQVEKGLDERALESERRRLEARLGKITDRAEAAVAGR